MYYGVLGKFTLSLKGWAGWARDPSPDQLG
jgi:hypothetical protein